MSSASNATHTAWELDVAWPVVTADGQRLGVVEGVHPQHIIVSTTFHSSTMLFVPVAAIMDIESDRVYLSVTLADVFHQDWTLMPQIEGMMPDTATGTATTSDDLHIVMGVAVVAVVSLATLFLVASGSVQTTDAAVAFIAFLGVAAVEVWACLVWYGIARA